MRIVYTLTKFPKLSESFILDEIVELLNFDIDIRIFSIINPLEKFQHLEFELHELSERTNYFLKKSSLKLLKSLFIYSIRSWRRFLPLDRISKMEIEKWIYTISACHFAEVARDFDLDLIHAHFAAGPATMAMHLSDFLKVPFTFTAHAGDIFKSSCVNSELMKKKFKETAGIVTISRYNRNHLIKLGVDPAKIRVIHCGIDIKKFKPEPRELAEKGQIEILSVARLVEKKGIEFLLKAISLLSKEKTNPAIKLKIVGSGTKESKLRRMTYELGVSKQIQFLGVVPDEILLDLYNSADVFALPCVIAQDGDRDGIPLALMEAMAMELPVVSTHISGIPELVTNGKEGLLVPQRDPESLAQAINKLAINPSLRKELGRNGRKKIDKQFNIRRTSMELLNFFQRIAETY